MWARILSLIVKELLALMRDPRGRLVLIAPPLIQLFIFTFAATLEVRNVDIAIVNLDQGRWGRELVARIEAAPTFDEVIMLSSVGEITEVIDRRRALAAIHIPQDFSRNIEAGQTADAQIVLDGRRANAAQILFGYVNRIVASVGATARPAPALAEGVVRHWFNPNLVYRWFMVPALVAIITMLTAIVVTTLSIARERELGTFDQLLVSPLNQSEIMLGKVAPGFLIGAGQGTLFIALAVFAFGVPLLGSLPLLYMAMVFFLAAVLGVGLFISAISATQQQAIIGAFAFIAPAIMLSGFGAPVENMPEWLQAFTMINPLRHFLVIVHGVFLKDMPALEILRNIAPLVVIAGITLPAAAWMFRARTQ